MKLKSPNGAMPATLLCVVVLSLPVFGVVAQPQRDELHIVDASTAQGLQALFTPNGDALPLVSAHRGGAAIGFPENCIATFEHTLRHTWSMLEIDLRYTKDAVLVLNHDTTLDRTTSGTGRVKDHTPPQDTGLCERIHAKGASCMAGSSRNIDPQFLSKQVADMEAIKPDYRALLELGVDVIETDIPREVGPLLYAGHPLPASKAKYFKKGLRSDR